MPAPDPMPRIEALLASMTLEEKIGQMTLVSAGGAVTGPGAPVDYVQAIRAGEVGAVSNLWGPERAHKVQRVALEETRLGIPLLLVMDVIHGHRTIFPVPIAEAGAFDPDLWQRTARVAASEAAADGLVMTYAPMLDVARDPRWGRMAESPGEDPWLAARFAHAKIRGFQGGDLAAADSLAATASIWPPTARPRPAATMRPWTSRSVRCTRSTCPRSGPLLRPGSRRSCRPSTAWPGCR
jgi:beta-glucosidase